MRDYERFHGDLLFTMCCLDSLAAILETLSTSLRNPIHTQLSDITKQVEEGEKPSFEIQSLAIALSQSFHLLSQMDRDIKDLRARLSLRAETVSQLAFCWMGDK